MEDITKTIRKERLAPLRGLSAVHVSLAPILVPSSLDLPHSQINSDAPDRDQTDLQKILIQRLDSIKRVQPIIERRLSELGIEALSREEMLNATGRPCLTVYIDWGKPKKKTSCSVRADLMQDMVLAQDSNIGFAIRTWESGVIKRKYPREGKPRSENEEAGGIEGAIEKLLNNFVEDYREANSPD